MNTPVIQAKNIGKKYNITHQRGGYISLRDVLATIIKRPFAFLKQKAKSVAGLEKKEEFWALRGIDFEVYKGEVVGVIGHNGAGKSTLLKILSQITPPTEGEIMVRGKIGSLLEVGTGFHPELTGRENIFLNGAILGMTRNEIALKFDDIVEFAAISKFLDTPVKYYSSGMYVRLAFSVAAHMEPDILLVDEVLAVGDVEFQKKCLGKMEQVTRDSGRTILFVSHNMSAIQSLCKRSILLENGKIERIGETREVIDAYIAKRSKMEAVKKFSSVETSSASITKVSVIDEAGSPRLEQPISSPFQIQVEFECTQSLPRATLSLLIYTMDRDLLLYSSEADEQGKISSFGKGLYKTTINIPNFLFNIGHYSFDVILHDPNISMMSEVRDMRFEIKNIDNPRSVIFYGTHPGKIAKILSYQVEKLN